MKIGLITLHSVDNFGSVLQTYATVSILNRLGHSVEIINYIRPQDRISVPIVATLKNPDYSLIKKSYSMIYKSLEKPLCRLITLKFLHRYLNLTRRYNSFEELKSDPPMSDVYITGSDQVWNSNYNEGINKAYFLEFAPESKKRIAFSASFGVDELKKNEQSETAKLFKKYHAISVRESSGLEILKKIGISNAKHVLDPTLVLNKSDWSKLAKPYKSEYPYLLLYTVDGAISLRASAYARKIARKKNLQIFQVTIGSFRHGAPGCNKYFFMRSPETFLSLLMGADFVVSVSFHGTAFSVNFEKQFISIMPDYYQSRVKSLLSLTGLKNRAVYSDDHDVDSLLSPIDFGPVTNRIQTERENSITFLRNALA